MMRLFCMSFLAVLLMFPARANNVRVKDLTWDPLSVTGQNVLKMTFKVEWDNSWRDDFNYDAVYVFFKFKVKDDSTWHHTYLLDGAQAQTAGYSKWLCPLSQAGVGSNMGVYIFRQKKGTGKASAEMEVSWNISLQQRNVTGLNIANGEVQIVAHALEMVYVPRGAFRIGDAGSNKTFRKSLFPILPQYDLVNSSYALNSSNKNSNPYLAADRMDINMNSAVSVWQGLPNQDNWWLIDFGEGNAKAVSYFGVNAFIHQTEYVPDTFYLEAAQTVAGLTANRVWKGAGKDYWVMAPDAYPVEKAIELDRALPYRYYRLYIPKLRGSGFPMINSIAMTDRELDTLIDRTVLIDDIETPKDSLRYIGAIDGSSWGGGKIPETFPNGYKGFFAMKYELTQEQYVRFLNKLTYSQQNSILTNRLRTLAEGGYIFGDPGNPSYRNGIILATKPQKKGESAVFANNLNSADEPISEADGQTIACNYMCIADMLAYADWAGLRPLTEMEYEKMSRPLYPYIPLRGEYAWSTKNITKARELGLTSGKPSEKPSVGNAVYGKEPSIDGPIRVGAFATGRTTQEEAGCGFSGAMELSGNLAEIYYNANKLGLTLIIPEVKGSDGKHRTAHGDGYVDKDGRYDGVFGLNKQWSLNVADIAVRGGSFMSDSSLLAVSDRTYHANYFPAIYQRDSTVTFRLGHSAPDDPVQLGQKTLKSVLVLENETTTDAGAAHDKLYRSVRTYKIKGNQPEGMEGVYTYLWYKQENSGLMKLIDGENDKDLIFDDFGADTLTSQTYYFKRRVLTPFADSRASSENMAVLTINNYIVNNGMYRSWADGTYARSAYEYRYPVLPYKYEGDTGSGIYRIDPDGPGGPLQPFDVYCDMDTDGGGWMLAGKFSNNDAKRWCAAKSYWTNTSVFGSASDVTTFADAKTPAWVNSKVNHMMFKTMRVPNKAFVTTTSISNRTLSTYFTTALANFPNTGSSGCYQSLAIRFVNSNYNDFPWINATGFQQGHITIGNYDKTDTQGVISGYRCSEDGEADYGLGSLEDAVFNTNSGQSDVCAGGSGAADVYNVLLFVK